MSRHISEIYSDELRRHLRPLFGNWPPNLPIAVGDFGKLEGNVFINFGNVKKFGISFAERSDYRKDQQSFASEGAVFILSQ